MSIRHKIDPSTVTVVYATDDAATVAAYLKVLDDMRAYDQRLDAELKRLGVVGYQREAGRDRGRMLALVWKGSEGDEVPAGWRIYDGAENAYGPPSEGCRYLWPVRGADGDEARRWRNTQVGPDRVEVMAEHGLPRHPQTEPAILGGARPLMIHVNGTVWAAYRDAPDTPPAPHWTRRRVEEWEAAAHAGGHDWPSPDEANTSSHS